jgi:hypothetical protein
MTTRELEAIEDPTKLSPFILHIANAEEHCRRCGKFLKPWGDRHWVDGEEIVELAGSFLASGGPIADAVNCKC